MDDEAVLRARVRQFIQQEKLPVRRPERIWGGPGVGAPCAVCELAVSKEEMEFEVEFEKDERDRSAHEAFDVYHVHVHCFAVWELVRKERPG